MARQKPIDDCTGKVIESETYYFVWVKNVQENTAMKLDIGHDTFMKIKDTVSLPNTWEKID